MTFHETAMRVPLWVRIWHWITAALFVILTVTGFMLHFAISSLAGLTYALANTVHDYTGLALAVVYAIYLPIAAATRYPGQYVPRGQRRWRQIRDQVAAYLRGHGELQQSERFNMVQKVIYLSAVFLLLPLLIVSGLIYLYYPDLPSLVPETVMGFDGLWPVALTHYLLGVLASGFLVVHVYMGLLGPEAKTALRRIVTGRG